MKDKSKTWLMLGSMSVHPPVSSEQRMQGEEDKSTITAADVKGEGDGEDEESKDEERVEEAGGPP